jgi:hypothetical protein
MRACLLRAQEEEGGKQKTRRLAGLLFDGTD